MHAKAHPLLASSYFSLPQIFICFDLFLASIMDFFFPSATTVKTGNIANVA
jgi:hypothetical protein